MAQQRQPNALLSTGRAPDTSLTVQLHPLVLLTISDYITRHTLREQQGPIVGAIIGRQDGRHVSLEHAFECKMAEQADGHVGDAVLDGSWFADRLQQYKDVHKAPALDLVALFTLGAVSGPQARHVPLLQHVQQLTGNDALLLLLFHADMVDALAGGKLPISLYDSFHEPAGDGPHMRFRELAFEVETGEAEMIGVDFVAKGGGNATAVRGTLKKEEAGGGAKAKGKGKVKDSAEPEEQPNGTSTSGVLSAADEELIASLTAKANAIKMLNQRIDLIRAYLAQLPPSALTHPVDPDRPPPDSTNHPLLRSISALLSRLPLLTPTQPSPAAHSTRQSAGLREKEAVHLTSLLASLTRSVAEAQALGQKFDVQRRDRASKSHFGRSGGGGGGGGGGGMGRFSQLGDEGVMAD